MTPSPEPVEEKTEYKGEGEPFWSQRGHCAAERRPNRAWAQRILNGVADGGTAGRQGSIELGGIGRRRREWRVSIKEEDCA